MAVLHTLGGSSHLNLYTSECAFKYVFVLVCILICIVTDH